MNDDGHPVACYAGRHRSFTEATADHIKHSRTGRQATATLQALPITWAPTELSSRGGTHLGIIGGAVTEGHNWDDWHTGLRTISCPTRPVVKQQSQDATPYLDSVKGAGSEGTARSVAAPRPILIAMERHPQDVYCRRLSSTARGTPQRPKPG